ncbi:chromosome partitioning protein, ParB family [Lachnospiraceae bacterium G11]|nr:chromosome partitioning protein, ParB family [Lachnospiraceae bacterium G11]
MAARGLGKGLDALIPSASPKAGKVDTKTKAVTVDENDDSPKSIVKITKVEPNREQPRKNFDEDALNELAESIKQFGVLQPILVQDRKDYYEIIAGERRWRAAMKAGLKEVPVIIKNLTEQEIMEISLIENLQREDLNPIEEALAYKRLLTEFNLKQEEVAERVSKSRTAVTNSMRLLKLDPSIQKMLEDGELTTGHARALLAIEDNDKQVAAAKKIVSDKLSVRDVEKLVKDFGKPAKEKKKSNDEMDVFYKDIEEKLKRSLGTKVSVNSKGEGAGEVKIEFYNFDELDKLVSLLSKTEE